MKLQQTIFVSSDEVTKLVTKYVEKKFSKKSLKTTTMDDGTMQFDFEFEEVDEKKEP